MYRNNRGITLIELIICIGIVGILVSTALPSLKILQSFSLECCSKELLYDLRKAQQKAVAERCLCKIEFDKINQAYTVYTYKYEKMMTSKEKVKYLPHGIKFDITNGRWTCYGDKIEFDRALNPENGSCTVSITNENGEYKSIVIGIATHYIYLKD